MCIMIVALGRIVWTEWIELRPGHDSLSLHSSVSMRVYVYTYIEIDVLAAQLVFISFY